MHNPQPIRREVMLQTYGREITARNAERLALQRECADNMRRFIRRHWSERQLLEFMERERATR